MKHTILAAAAAVLLAAGGMTAQADSLTLSGGETLDLGSRVGVLDGQRTFFGAQLHDWIWQPNAAASLEKAMETTNVVKDEAQRKELASMALDILKHGKVYQVRSATNDTYYQGMVLSLSVSDADLLKLALLGNAGPVIPEAETGKAKANKQPTIVLPEDEPGAKKAETPAAKTGKVADIHASGAPAEEEPAAEENQEASLEPLLHGLVQVTSHSKWENGVSKNGVAYRTGNAQISFTKNGFTIPLYVKGIVMKEDGRSAYTLFIADQVSGTYFNPILDKALKGAKK